MTLTTTSSLQGSGAFSSSDDSVLALPEEEGFTQPTVETIPAVKLPRTKGGKPRRMRLVDRDFDILHFLGSSYYAYDEAVARKVGSTPASINSRLQLLHQHGFVQKTRLAGSAVLWHPTQQGMDYADLPFKALKEISFATVQHTVALGNLTAELQRNAPDAKDVLGIAGWGESFPPHNVVLPPQTANTIGEILVTEREIRRAQRKDRGFGEVGLSTAELRANTLAAAKSEYSLEFQWDAAGLFVIYGEGGKTGQHVPDLVVTRRRSATNEPENIAIEVELTEKSNSEWRRILRAYKDHAYLYKRVIYFTHSRAIKDALTRIADDIGLRIGDRTADNPRIILDGIEPANEIQLEFRKYTFKDNHQKFLG